MLRDWGSWDSDFNAITARIRKQILAIVHDEGTHECIPMQGSGTFSVEAAIGTMVRRDGHVLVPVNGACCQRIARICRTMGRRLSTLDYPGDRTMRAEDIDAALQKDPSITHVAVIHCETGTGVLNPLEAIARVVASHGRGLIVDAMSSFGAIDIDARRVRFDAVIAASGKCLEGVPGRGFVIARREALAATEGNSQSLALDLHDQWQYMEKTTQWRFTPPTLWSPRSTRPCSSTWKRAAWLPAARATPAIASCWSTAWLPSGCAATWTAQCRFHHCHISRARKTFYQKVKARGYILYPGKLTEVETFRVGCIGHFGDAGIPGAVKAIAEVFAEMGVQSAACVA
ncbi:2-aminoethylphosphonate--pyruvate transaminase 2 [Cupriavidus taiwanensis]|uniref:2-aminoethylphosphonate--pyruvate transaminase n=1 Tax=Cupriavidus taiwanensis TaxID=164546 RepID=A0A375CRR6_9BURK|nr:2-aminoethylphosphonate--pyruvate transaminase 2 [Cupriavidus taiwanensis]